MSKHTNLYEEIEDLTPKKTDWIDILICVTFGLFFAWVVIEFIIGPDELIAWFE